MSVVHQQHCMNYLHQLFLCRTDMILGTLRGTDAEDDDSNLIYHLGAGLVHMCNDIQALVQEVIHELELGVCCDSYEEIILFPTQFIQASHIPQCIQSYPLSRIEGCKFHASQPLSHNFIAFFMDLYQQMYREMYRT